ncbi:MAG TPA: fructose-bisphosphatase class II, partial [Pseudomonadota bacterium]|nr:fructose-bisphosphatase class II [Pseudomonadota bacterium]
GDPERTGIDMYLGVGGAREGVIAAAAMKCIGGQMQGRLLPDGAGQGRGAEPAAKKVLSIADMVRGDVLFAATGVTDGAILSGVEFRRDSIVTDTIVLRSSSRTMREIRARHTDLTKFGMRTAP